MSSGPGEKPPERTLGADTKTPGQAYRDDQANRIAETNKVRAKESLEAAFRAATIGEYRTVGLILARRLLPALGVDEMSIEVVDDYLESSVLVWDYYSVRRFCAIRRVTR